jgi:hypothetical protein
VADAPKLFRVLLEVARSRKASAFYCKLLDQKGKEDVHGEPAGDIVTRHWGERCFYAVDPFGNGLCFSDERTLFT